MSNATRILILEHDPTDIDLLQRELRKGVGNYVAEIVENEHDYERALKNFAPDIILSDYSLPSFDGFSAFKLKERITPLTPFIFVSGTIGEENSIELIKNGVTDYALKDKLFTLTTKVNRALKEARAKRERENAKEQLIKSEKYFRSIIENSADGIALLDGNMRVVDISPNCKSINGYDREELMGDFQLGLLHPDDVQAISDVFNNALKNPGKSQLIQYRFKKKSGEYAWTEANYINHLNDPDINAIILNYRDVTDKKTIEEQIKKMNAELEERVKERTEELLEANKALEAFSYSVSHDLRAPLRAVASFTKIIQKEYESSFAPELKELFSHITAGSNRMSAIIQDLLSLARFGKEKLNLAPVDMTALFNRVWADINLNTENLATLEIAPLAQVEADISMMEQVVVNLLSNAIKYSSKKEKPIVKVGYEELDGKVIFFVKDNGSGFDMKHYSRLFGAFQRLHSINDFEGTGVGLLLVKKIIEKHGGSVWAESKVGEGATFYFTVHG